MDELELDFSEITWEAGWMSSSDDVELDFSEFEWEENTWEEWGKEEEWTPTEPAAQEEETATEEVVTEESESTEEGSEESNEDSDLDEIEKLLKDIEEWTEDTSETIDKADDVISDLWNEWQAWEAGALLEQLKTDNSQLKTQVDQLNKLVSKINKEKWDIMMRNTELELYGNIDDPNLVYLNWNLEKAKWGDDKAKNRIVWILDDLRSEIAGMTKEEEEIENSSDLAAKVSSFNNSSNPNTKSSWWIDDYEINL